MADTVIKPEEFADLNLSQYEFKFKKDLDILGKNKNKLHGYLFIEDYYFGGQKSDLLLFVDVKEDGDWQEKVPIIKAIANGDLVVDGKELFEDTKDRNRAKKYLFNSIYGDCKVATVADFDEDGNDDYAIVIVNAFGKRGATKDKIVKLLKDSKKLFDGQDVHVMLSREFREILKESREIEDALREARKDGKERKQQDSEGKDVIPEDVDEA